MVGGNGNYCRLRLRLNGGGVMMSHQGAKRKTGTEIILQIKVKVFEQPVDRICRSQREVVVVVGISGWNISMVLWSFGFISSTGVLSCIAHNKSELGVGRQGCVSMISSQTRHHGHGGWLPTGAYRVLHDFYCGLMCTAAVLTSPQKVQIGW